ncbi:MAG: (Fe-S)-binding protein [Promethearchaeota archaeon]
MSFVVGSVDLYTSTIEPWKYLPKTDCGACGFASCAAFCEAVEKGSALASACPEMDPDYGQKFELLFRAKEVLPEVSINAGIVAIDEGVTPVGDPDAKSPVLVTGNFLYTQSVLASVLFAVPVDAYILSTDTMGCAVDMAIPLNFFTGRTIKNALDRCDLGGRVARGTLVVPGLAKDLKGDFEAVTGWEVLVGPVCALELPVYLRKFWPPPA